MFYSEGGGARRLQLKLPGDVRAIDIVADIIKWLEYDVLCTDLAAGTPTWDEAVIFGITAAVSAQVYKDSSMVFGLGVEGNRDAVLERSQRAWISTYLKQAASAGTLFGIYESARRPLSGFLKGGVTDCVGSENLDLCLDSFAHGGVFAGTKDLLLMQIMEWSSLFMQGFFGEAGL